MSTAAILREGKAGLGVTRANPSGVASECPLIRAVPVGSERPQRHVAEGDLNFLVRLLLGLLNLWNQNVPHVTPVRNKSQR